MNLLNLPVDFLIEVISLLDAESKISVIKTHPILEDIVNRTKIIKRLNFSRSFTLTYEKLNLMFNSKLRCSRVKELNFSNLFWFSSKQLTQIINKLNLTGLYLVNVNINLSDLNLMLTKQTQLERLALDYNHHKIFATDFTFMNTLKFLHLHMKVDDVDRSVLSFLSRCPELEELWVICSYDFKFPWNDEFNQEVHLNLKKLHSVVYSCNCQLWEWRHSLVRKLMEDTVKFSDSNKMNCTWFRNNRERIPELNATINAEIGSINTNILNGKQLLCPNLRVVQAVNDVKGALLPILKSSKLETLILHLNIFPTLLSSVDPCSMFGSNITTFKLNSNDCYGDNNLDCPGKFGGHILLSALGNLRHLKVLHLPNTALKVPMFYCKFVGRNLGANKWIIQWKIFIKKVPCVEEFCLTSVNSSISDSSEETDDTLRVVSRWKLLKRFSIEQFSIKCGKGLRMILEKCSLLESLSVENIGPPSACIYAGDLIQGLKHCKNLKDFRMIHKYLDNEKGLINALAHIPKLQRVFIRTLVSSKKSMFDLQPVIAMVETLKSLVFLLLDLPNVTKKNPTSFTKYKKRWKETRPYLFCAVTKTEEHDEDFNAVLCHSVPYIHFIEMVENGLIALAPVANFGCRTVWR